MSILILILGILIGFSIAIVVCSFHKSHIKSDNKDNKCLYCGSTNDLSSHYKEYDLYMCAKCKEINITH